MKGTQIDKADLLFRKVTLYDDEEAYRILFYDFFSPLCAFAYRFLEDKEACEDVVQEIFFLLWKNRKNLDIHVSTRNYLLTCVRNACLDLLRRKESEKKWMEDTMREDFDKTNDDLYSTMELEHLLNDALDKLPEKMSSTFRMNRFEGKTYAEIAEEKQISVKTVEAYMTKTLKFLKVELKDYLPLLMIVWHEMLG